MKATHLHIPSDEKPLEINGTNFFSKHFEFRSKLYKYSDIVSIKYFAEVSRTNYFITDRSNEFVLYLNIKENFPLEKRLNKNIIDLSTSSFMGIGSGQITRDKISFMQEYLKKITFDTRVDLYLKQIKSNGFFHYLGQYKASGYKIYNNGDIQKGDNIIVNILEAYKIKALQYGEYINSLLGLTS
ncbi:MAG: hypothetical protein EXR16_05250, partial [Bacteroidetes bacterium]|nr:hypothetical protein [Bacteroidota bacterium]